MPADTDVLLVGAGPAALFAVFQLGLYDLRCHLVDGLDRAGGQCAVLYPDKPIYDVPGFPAISGDELTERLLDQGKPSSPQFSLGRTVVAFARQPDGRFRASLDDGTAIACTVVVLATGLGLFSTEGGEGGLQSGPQAEWPLVREGGAFLVDAERFETSEAGVFAIGDACHYPGKLKLILSAFHEAALMTQAIRRICLPGGRTAIEYTTSSSRLKKKIAGEGGLQE